MAKNSNGSMPSDKSSRSNNFGNGDGNKNGDRNVFEAGSMIDRLVLIGEKLENKPYVWIFVCDLIGASAGGVLVVSMIVRGCIKRCFIRS